MQCLWCAVPFLQQRHGRLSQHGHGFAFSQQSLESTSGPPCSGVSCPLSALSYALGSNALGFAAVTLLVLPASSMLASSSAWAGVAPTTGRAPFRSCVNLYAFDWPNTWYNQFLYFYICFWCLVPTWCCHGSRLEVDNTECPVGSVAGELSQLGVTRVELPELRTQLNSVERQLRLLPHLVHHYHIWFEATLNQTIVCHRDVVSCTLTT